MFERPAFTSKCQRGALKSLKVIIVYALIKTEHFIDNSNKEKYEQGFGLYQFNNKKE